MKEYVRFIDGLPWILRLILALPVFDWIVYGVYRIAKGLNKKDNVMVLVGILWFFIGWVGFVIDIFTLLVNKKVTFFA